MSQRLEKVLFISKKRLSSKTSCLRRLENSAQKLVNEIQNHQTIGHNKRPGYLANPNPGCFNFMLKAVAISRKQTFDRESKARRSWCGCNEGPYFKFEDETPTSESPEKGRIQCGFWPCQKSVQSNSYYDYY
jgi:hypothetical protein